MVREVAVPLCSGKPLFLNVHPIELQERWLVQPDDPMFFHDHDLYLEITESVPMTHFELCLDVLREIRGRANVQLVVDDLGAGYSNLKCIADLEPKVVKLDRGLIENITHESRQQKLVAGVVRPGTTVNIGKSRPDFAGRLRYVPAIDKAREELGLVPRVPLAEAIRRTAAFHGPR